MKLFISKITFALALLLIQIGITKAQDMHFSQYNSSPLLLNPALAGLNDGDYRIYTNFRTQWMTVSKANVYRTFAVGADVSVGKATRFNSYGGLGISFISDQAGEVSLNTNRIDVTAAYHFMLNRRGTTRLSAGLQAGFTHKSINASKSVYGSQYNPSTGVVDPYGNTETLNSNKTMFADMGAGMILSTVTRYNTNLYIGFSASHINQPKTSFLSTTGADKAARLAVKYTVHGGICVPVANDRLFILPNFLVMVQSTNYQFNVGCHFKAALGNARLTKTFFTLGVQYRGLRDAVILNTRLDIKGFSAMLSYDANISKLLPASKSVGAPEVSLMYQGGFRKSPRPGYCPVMF